MAHGIKCPQCGEITLLDFIESTSPFEKEKEILEYNVCEGEGGCGWARCAPTDYKSLADVPENDIALIEMIANSFDPT